MNNIDCFVGYSILLHLKPALEGSTNLMVVTLTLFYIKF